MFSGKSPSAIFITSFGLLIYSAWQMIQNILPNLQIFKVIYDTIYKAIEALKEQYSNSMTNIQFLLYVIVLVAFIILIAKFWKFTIYALLFIVFILICNFVYYAWSTGANSSEWFVFVVMVISFYNVFTVSKSGGLI